jgi:acetyltransferase-like isoleucine patch superfamily enzyme
MPFNLLARLAKVVSRYKFFKYRDYFLSSLPISSHLTRSFNIYSSFPYPRLTVGESCLLAPSLFFEDLTGSISIGNNVYCSSDVKIFCRNSIVIGSNVAIASQVVIYDHDSMPLNHLMRRNITTYVTHNYMCSSFYRQMPWAGVNSSPICIEDDVWIGTRCLILKGVTIGSSSVVAAGSVVTKNVPPFSLVAGVPARIIRGLD